MTNNDLSLLKKWFSNYTASFYTSDEEHNKNLRLKEEHSKNVSANAKYLAEALSLPAEKIILAESIALFHDIGRFPQYEKYGTFEDRKSVNHGLLGSETLVKEDVLKNLSIEEQEIIAQTVKFHNTFQVPSLKDENIIFFIKLIRDADKLDILRVFIDYYESPEDKRASATAFGLPDTPEYSKEILKRLYNKHKVSYSLLKTVNDFKLINLSWGYALNFNASYMLLQERDYLNRVIKHLPKTEEITRATTLIKEHVQEILQDSD